MRKVQTFHDFFYRQFIKQQKNKESQPLSSTKLFIMPLFKDTSTGNTIELDLDFMMRLITGESIRDVISAVLSRKGVTAEQIRNGLKPSGEYCCFSFKLLSLTLSRMLQMRISFTRAVCRVISVMTSVILTLIRFAAAQTDVCAMDLVQHNNNSNNNNDDNNSNNISYLKESISNAFFIATC